MELSGTLLNPYSKKNFKKSTPEIFLIFQEMELSSSKIKNFFIFPGMELSSLIFFLYFRKELPSSKNRKNHSPRFCFLKNSFSYIAGNRTFLHFLKKKLFLYFGKTKLFYIFLKKVFLIFLEMEVSSLKLKKLLIL